MNQTQANAKEPKLLGDGNRLPVPRLTDGRTAPTRLISAGEKAQLKAAEAEAALRKSFPPPAAQKAEEKGEEKGKPSGWTLVVGHAF